SATTETSQLFANPDGTMTLSASATPVRVRQAGAWVPVDTTLVANADGTWGPRAVLSPVSFSGGGTGTLVKFERGGAPLSWTWPASLPAPTVSGDTVTYTDILPGVDLRLTARADGFSELFVVRTAAAATQVGMAAPTFGMSVKGGAGRSDGAGGFSVVSGSGA